MVPPPSTSRKTSASRSVRGEEPADSASRARLWSIADIAHSLGLSQGTVRNHVSSSMLKMDARTRAEAASLARAAGWL